MYKCVGISEQVQYSRVKIRIVYSCITYTV